MRATIRDHLAFLYGESAAEEASNAIEDRISAFRGNGRSAFAPLSERDAMLITYGGQVRAGGEAPLKTLRRFLAARAGVFSAVHLLPFYPYSSDDGFSVKDYHAVDPALGSWEDVRAFSRDFDIMFDAVLNHASAQGDWFARFLRQEPGWETAFVTVEGSPDLSAVARPRALPLLTTFDTSAGPKQVWTTFSADQADINFSDPRMLLRAIDVLLFYAAGGARFLRLDAIAFLWKEIGTGCIHLEQTHRIIQLLRAVLDETAPDLALITETNVPHHDNVAYFGDGTNEAQLVYNFALPPLVFHTFRTGNSSRLTAWAKSLELPSEEVTFLNFLASHDGIGLNPARGILSSEEISALCQAAADHGGFVSYKSMPDGSREPYELNISYFDALSNPASSEPAGTQIRRFVAAQSILLSLKGLPGIYFHSFFGSRGDVAGALKSGIPRRINREKLPIEQLLNELADPDSRRSKVSEALTELLRARSCHGAFNPFGRQEILDFGPEVFAVRRSHLGESALCVINVTGHPAMVEGKRIGPYEVVIDDCGRR